MNNCQCWANICVVNLIPVNATTDKQLIVADDVYKPFTFWRILYYMSIRWYKCVYIRQLLKINIFFYFFASLHLIWCTIKYQYTMTLHRNQKQYKIRKGEKEKSLYHSSKELVCFQQLLFFIFVIFNLLIHIRSYSCDVLCCIHLCSFSFIYFPIFFINVYLYSL